MSKVGWPMSFDISKQGYGFLQKISGKNTLHPGRDLNKGPSANSDLGLPVVSPFSGEVVFARNAGDGWGNLVVIYSVELGRWARLAHFATILVKVGQKVDVGQKIGTCGKTGTNSPHCHFEILRKALASWTAYPHGWTRAKILEYWEDPKAFIDRIKESEEAAAPQIPEWAKKDWEAALAKLPVLKGKDPFKELDGAFLAEILKDAGIILEAGQMPLYRLAVVLRKLGVL